MVARCSSERVKARINRSTAFDINSASDYFRSTLCESGCWSAAALVSWSAVCGLTLDWRHCVSVVPERAAQSSAEKAVVGAERSFPLRANSGRGWGAGREEGGVRSGRPGVAGVASRSWQVKGCGVMAG